VARGTFATSWSTRRSSAARTKKKGDPKNPSLASAALLDFIGPAHSAEELRLPMPADAPRGMTPTSRVFSTVPYLSTVAERHERAPQAEHWSGA
jgi:hypothetical protein